MSAAVTIHHRPVVRLLPHSSLSAKITLFPHHLPLSPGFELYKHGKMSTCCGSIRAINGGESAYVSPWNEKPYETLPNGKRAYLDEQDIVTFLDPPKELIPLDPTLYNPAAYIWKKIEEIPEERRHRLLNLLEPIHISRAWQIAGTRYEDPKLAKRSEFNWLSSEDGGMTLECYNCRMSGGPMPIAWINFFKKAMFSCKDGNVYGRIIGGSFLEQLARNWSPLYFVVRNHKEVMSTEQPCDFAYEFGDGLFDLHEYPQDFPRPAKHPYPFNDQAVVYVRHLGPGVLIGQAWQEGIALEQVPRKLCGEILMVKDYSAA
ncbi:WD repeat protein [Parasponia andersonii]|uniref:WD repeat protein n=1 Tax=Parasponia andersonii TaxID=3476 RepID=A0A2P5DKA1_PARAD|nr:WD repeat protein [Parasponia andersonii]